MSSKPGRIAARAQAGSGRRPKAVGPKSPPEFPSGGGEMGALIGAKDWSKTSIGPIERWPPSLRMMVRFLLANRFPLLLWWGPEYVSIYNDAYRPVLGSKHPWALGTPVRECWSEIWEILKPLIDAPFNGGPATWMDDILLEINRHGFLEETHFTVAYSPVPDESAPSGIGGVLATVHEITEKVIGERRIAALRDLGARTAEAKTAEDACALARQALAGHGQDLPFALIYLLDGAGQRARLACAIGMEEGALAAPAIIDINHPSGADDIWPFAEVLSSEATVTVENLPGRFHELPTAPWSDPPHTALVVPIKATMAHQFAGFLVAGASPRLRLDSQYRSFFELVAGQIATAIATARAYDEERKRAEALAEIDRAKTLFFSNVSHEFRTPLTLMLGPLEDALGASDLPAAERERLDVAHRNSLRLLRLVNSLLDFSRIEAGRARTSYQPTDLAALTAELTSNFRSACERAGIKLVVDCPPLPEPVYLDPDMWEKIVLNLLSNAFKFTFEGEIAVIVRSVGAYAELTVRDTGVGIPESELPRLFERFHRIEGQKSRTYEGSGIGLALVQELVKLHGGSIRAESAQNNGTTFNIAIPFGTDHLERDRIGAERSLASTSVRAEAYTEEALRWLPDDSYPETNSAADDVSAASLRREHARVLVADDNADMRAYVRRLLERHCDVELVADGQAALQAMRERRPDIVVADIMMPRLDGFGLLRAIRSDPALSDIAVIIVSARAGEESRIEGLQAGADDYLVKPFSARDLLARIQSNLALVRIRTEASEKLRASEAWLAGQKEALQSAMNGAPLEISLGFLVSTAVAQMKGEARCAFYLASADKTELHHITGMPEAYSRCVDGFKIGPDSLACGLAVYTARPVITADVTKEPLWKDWLSLADEFHYRGCWSFPIETSAGKVVGTLAMYHEEPREAGPDDHALAAVITQAAAIIISRHEEVEERERAEAHRELLIHELNHRVKNTLATVQSVASQTLRNAKSTAEARAMLDSRLVALAKMHDVLTRDNWEGAGLREIVANAIAAYAGEGHVSRFEAEGSDLRLQPKAALALSMALHELATNAVKYGALSNGTGRVEIGWGVVQDDPQRFHLRWAESGGPPVEEPRRRGFGSRLVERGLAQDLGGKVRLKFEPSGLICTIDAPLSEISAMGGGGYFESRLKSAICEHG